MAASEPVVLYGVEDRIARITLAPPAGRLPLELTREDAAEGRAARAERRAPEWKGR